MPDSEKENGKGPKIHQLIIDGNTMEREWQEFRAKVVPPTAPAIQHEEMRLAFFAGAFTTLNITMMVTDSGAPDSVAEIAIDVLFTEITTRMEQLIKEKKKKEGIYNEH